MKKYSVGIDLGGTKILIALVEKASGDVVGFVKKKIKKDKGPKNITKKLIEGIDELIENFDVKADDVSSIGVGSSGQIDRKNGIIVGAPNLDCFDFPIGNIIKENYGIPVFVGNDVEIAAIGEQKFGAGKHSDDFVCIFVGTGVGVDLNGRPCACGAHGCLEAYASRSAIETRIEGALKKGRSSCISEYLEENKSITSGMIKKSIERNDELVLQCVNEASEYLSGGIASIINFINPELVILGGGLIEAVEYFYNETVKKAKLKSLPVPAKTIKFKKAELGDFSGVIGAAFLEDRIL